MLSFGGGSEEDRSDDSLVVELDLQAVILGTDYDRLDSYPLGTHATGACIGRLDLIKRRADTDATGSAQCRWCRQQ